MSSEALEYSAQRSLQMTPSPDHQLAAIAGGSPRDNLPAEPSPCTDPQDRVIKYCLKLLRLEPLVTQRWGVGTQILSSLGSERSDS